MKNKQFLIRQQLDAVLMRFRDVAGIQRPPKGWIRAIRHALGMTAGQLGKRANMTQQRITAIEREELNGTLTLNTLHKVAAATETRLVYGFVPKGDLDMIVRTQARKYAEARLMRIKHTMSLEGQSPTSAEWEHLLSLEIEEALRTEGSKIWDAEA